MQNSVTNQLGVIFHPHFFQNTGSIGANGFYTEGQFIRNTGK